MMSVASSGSIASRRSAASSRGRRRRMAAAFAGSSSSRISGISSSGNRVEEDGDLVFVEPDDDVGPVGWSQAIGQTADAELFALGDQVADFIEQLVRGHGRSKRHEGRLRFVRSSRGDAGSGSATFVWWPCTGRPRRSVGAPQGGVKQESAESRGAP